MAGEQAHKRVASSAAPAEAELGRGVTDEVLVVETGAGEDVAKQERVCLSARAISVVNEARPQRQHSTPTPNPGGGTMAGYPGFDTSGAYENSEHDSDNLSYCEAASARPTNEKRAAVDGSNHLLASQIAPGAHAAGLESSVNKRRENPSIPNYEAQKSSPNDSWLWGSWSVKNDGDVANPTNIVCSREAPAKSVVDVANESGGQQASLRWSREKGKRSRGNKGARSLVGAKMEKIELEEEGIEAGMCTVPAAEPAGIDAAAVEPDIMRSGDDMNRTSSAEVAVADEPPARVTQVKSFIMSRRASSDGMRPDIVLSASSESGTTLEDDARSRVTEAAGDRPLSGRWTAGVRASAGLGPLPLAESFQTDGQDSQTPRPSIIQSDGSFGSSTAGSHQTASSMTRDGSNTGRDCGINFQVGEELLQCPDSVEGNPRERESVVAIAMVSADGGPGSVHADEKVLEGTQPGKGERDLDSARTILGMTNVKEAVSYPGLESTLRSASGSANASVDIRTHPAEAAAVAPQDGGKQGTPETARPSAVADRTAGRACASVDGAPALVTPMCLTPKVDATETNPAHKDRYVGARFPRSTPLSGPGTTPAEGQRESDSRTSAVVKTKPIPERNDPEDSALHNAPVSTPFQREGGKLENMFPLRMGVGGPWVGANEVEAGGDGNVGISVEEAAAIMGGNPCLRFASGSSWTTTATSTALGDTGVPVPAGSPATAAKRGRLKLDDGTSFGSFADPHDFISPEPEGCDGNTRARKVVSEFFLAPMLSPGDPLLVNISLGAAASVGDVSGSNVEVDGRKKSTVVSSSSGAEAPTTPVMSSPVSIVAGSQADRRAVGDAMADSGTVDSLAPLAPSLVGEEGNALSLVAVVRESEAEVGGVDPAASASVPLGVTPPVTAEGRASPAQSIPVVWSARDDTGVDTIEGRASEDDSLKAGDVTNDLGQTNNHPMTGNAEATGDLSMMGGEAELPRPGSGGCCILS